MLNAPKLKRCRFVGYDVSSTWRSVHQAGAAFNHVALGDLLRKLRPGTRWCVEAHIVAESFWRDLASLRTLRPRCRALVMVRVRQPLAWYQSYYSWTVLGKQRGREEGYGANFSEWLAGAPNLQSRLLLFGDAAGGPRWEQKGADRLQPGAPRRLTVAQRRGVQRILQAADIVAPVERLDESLVLLRQLAGGWLDTRYSRTRPGPTHGPWEARRPQRVVAGVHALCAEGASRRACAAAAAEAAPDDHELYVTVCDRFERQLRVHAGPGLEQALRKHVASVRTIHTSRVESAPPVPYTE